MLELDRVVWSTPADTPVLRHRDLHLWEIRCGADGADLPALWPLLSQRERKKAERLIQERHRQRYVRAHAGLRRVLSTYLNISPQRIEFSYGSVGKPTVTGGPEFNLTTSADLALAAVCLDRPVGIDCEFLRPHSDPIAIAHRMFTAEDADRVAATPDAERLDAFSRAWTSLEASVKADGRGLFRSGKAPPLPKLDVLHFVPETGYVAAIACPELPPQSAWVTLRLV